MENITKLNLSNKIYEIRGQKVMLDFELAEIYGYDTRAFNKQVRNNLKKFGGENFRFQLSQEEYQNLMCKNYTPSWGGRRKMPYAFTEQGIYMLMTVLRGELATKQSRALVLAFKQMKDYLIANQGQISGQEFIALSNRVSENASDIKNLALEQAELKAVVTSFIEADKKTERILLDGKYVDADFVYASIYNTAKKSIIIIDNYIGLKTLVLLKDIRKVVKCTIYTGAFGNKELHKVELEDFKKQYLSIKLEIKTGKTNKIHDRFIIIDKDTENEKIYHCGGSSKDAGNKKTVISELKVTDELKEALGV